MSSIEEARLDKLDNEAQSIETHLFGPSAKLISKAQRDAMKAKLVQIYADMARCVERLAASLPPRSLP